MTYQDQLLNNLMRNFELAVLNYSSDKSVLNSQKLAEARHELMRFMKQK